MADTPSLAPDQPLPGAFELLKPSWQAVKLNFITLIEFIVIPIVLSVLSAFLFRQHATTVRSTLRTGFSYNYSYSTTGNSSYGAGWYVANAITIIVSALFAPGITYTLLQGAKGKSIDFMPALRKGLSYFWRYVGVTICTVVVVGIGFLLLIVPGIYMLRRYYLSQYYLVDRNVGVFEAMKLSAEESTQHGGAVLGVVGVQILFTLLFIIPVLGWIAGAILSIMYYNAPALRYSQITKLHRSKPTQEA